MYNYTKICFLTFNKRVFIVILNKDFSFNILKNSLMCKKRELSKYFINFHIGV